MPPDLTILTQPRFSQPQDWSWHHFTNGTGQKIRYGFVLPQEKPKAAIICLPGFREFGEKYFELAHDMLKRGFAFCTMDWAGQGGSTRLLLNDPDKVDSIGFEQNILDLHQLIEQHLKPSIALDVPVFILAHSMGGHIALRYLHDYPNGFIKAAALSAPLIKIFQFAAYPSFFARLITTVLKFKPTSYVPGHEKAVKLSKGMQPGKGYSSSDPVRDQIHNLWSDNTDFLRMKGPTTRWLYETIRSCSILQKRSYLKDIKTPVLVGIAGQDKIVFSKATEELVKFLPNGHALFIPESRHEILMERDEIRDVFLKEFDEFISPFILNNNKEPNAMMTETALNKARLSDRIFYALQLANDQKDVQIAETLISALDMAMTRNTGGGEFVERRDYSVEYMNEIDRLNKIKGE